MATTFISISDPYYFVHLLVLFLSFVSGCILSLDYFYWRPDYGSYAKENNKSEATGAQRRPKVNGEERAGA